MELSGVMREGRTSFVNSTLLDSTPECDENVDEDVDGIEEDLNISTEFTKTRAQSRLTRKRISSSAVSRPGGIAAPRITRAIIRERDEKVTNVRTDSVKSASVHKEEVPSFSMNAKQRGSWKMSTQVAPTSVDEVAVHETENGEDYDLFNIQLIRKKIRYFLTTTLYGKLYTHTLVLLSVVSTITIIVQAYFEGYFDELSGDNAKFAFYLKQLDLALSVLFFIDWSLQFFLADHITEFLTSFYSMIDVVTVVPTFVLYNFSVKGYYDISTPGDWLLYILSALSATRILRSLRLRRYTVEIQDEVVRHLSDMVLIFVSMIFFDAALIQFLEKHVDTGLDFNDWLYYVFVTLATVGYGDISPSSLLGRIAAMVFVFLAVTLVPSLTSSLIEKMNKASIYARAYFKPSGINSKHIVICGNMDSVLLSEFFGELFHEDHDDMNLKAVIMQPCSPSASMMAILEDPLYSLHLTYLDGSALNKADLIRARVDSAIGIFVMTNKNSANPDQEDAKTILEHFCIRRHLSEGNNEVTLCVQLLRPENRTHLSESRDDAGDDLVICLDEIRMGLIAKTLLYPGANTLVFNLLSSFSDIDDVEEEAIMKLKRSEEIEIDNLETLSTQDWEDEYIKGCDWEIYTTELSSVFTGAKFCEVSYALYLNSGVLLIGMMVAELSGAMDSRILLNPASMRIPPKSDFRVEAIVLAKNKQSSDLSFSSNDSQMLRMKLQHLFTTPLATATATTEEVDTPVRRSSVIDMMTVLLKRVSTKDVRDALPKIKEPPSHKSSLFLTSISEQERKQAQADEYIERNYYRRLKAANLNDYTVKTTLGEEFPSVSHHFLIVAKSLDSLPELIKPLRAKYLGKCVPIVILSPNEMKRSAWANLSMMSSIFFVRGSGLEENDLIKCGVYKASRIVVLAEYHEKTDNLIANESLVDADAVFIYHFVKRMNKKAKVCVEMVHPTNIGYLDTKSAKGSLAHGYKISPQFAAGELFTTTALDNLCCQAFYNPMMIRVLTKLIGGADYKEDGELGVDTLLTSEKENIKGKKKSSGLHNIVSSTLYQIPIPALETRTYGSLFQHLISQGMIPIALYRGVSTNLSPRMNHMPYVFTNPQIETEVFSCDQVFVLSQKPQEFRNSKSSHVSEKDSMRENKEHVRRVGRAIENDVSTVLETQKILIDEVSNASGELEEKINDILQDLNGICAKAKV